MQPIVLGAWFPRIPQIQSALDLSEAGLAFALMGMPIGLLTALTFGGRLAETLGTRGLLTWGLLAYLILMPLPAFATSGAMLFVFLAVAGLALAIAELSLNVVAAEVENRADKPIMNGCHGFWSIGVLLGSVAGSLFAEFEVGLGFSQIILSLISLLPLILAARAITNYAVQKSNSSDTDTSKRLSKPLVFVALFAFGIAMTEGAMADWSAVYMTKTFDASPGLAGASYTLFALLVAAGRFQGDGLKARYGVEVLARNFAAIALLGLAIRTFSPVLPLSFLGIALLGYGVAIGFPLAVSAASALPGKSSASNVAVLTQVSLCGFLVGPPLIGFIAEFSNMRIGLMALFPALLTALFLARYLRPQS